MPVVIKHKDIGHILLTLDVATLSGAYLEGAYLEGAYLSGVNLSRANLSRANLSRANLSRANLEGAILSGADLSGADLSGADLSGAILPTGETWEDYLKEVIPALCQAGGRSLADVAATWMCHTWQNGPMAVAFGVDRPSDIPALHRPRVQQFIQFFAACLLPCPVASEETADAP